MPVHEKEKTDSNAHKRAGLFAKGLNTESSIMAAVEGQDNINEAPRQNGRTKRQRRANPLEDISNNNNSNNNGGPNSTGARRRQGGGGKAKPRMLYYDEEKHEFRLVLRSCGSSTRCKIISVVLSEPAEDEECMIALEPIKEYNLPFLPAGTTVWESNPALKKASLPCGHSFSALALLYHFAKNAMTCPCCRAGHDKVVLADSSLPPHIRRPITRHLLEVRVEETRDQIAADARVAMSTLQAEVSPSSYHHHLPTERVTRITLWVTAWDSADVTTTTSSYPPISLQIPLSSSLTLHGLAFASYGYNLHQLNLSLRLLPFRPQAFEMAIVAESVMHPPVALFRTAKFVAEGPGMRSLFATEPAADGSYQSIDVVTTVSPDGRDVFSHACWNTTLAVFASYLSSWRMFV